VDLYIFSNRYDLSRQRIGPGVAEANPLLLLLSELYRYLAELYRYFTVIARVVLTFNTIGVALAAFEPPSQNALKVVGLGVMRNT
jgi:hypothetical protein